MHRLFCIVLILCFNAELFAQQKLNNPLSGVFVWCKTYNFSNEENLKEICRLSGISKDFVIEKAFKTADPQLDKIYTIENINKKDVEFIQGVLRNIAWIEFVEEIPEYEWFYTPNDLHPNQWNLKKIQAEKAWDLSKGGKNIVVALVDDGLDTLHSDLKGVLWHNVNEIKGNGLDDDANGYVDDYYGWDVADNDEDPCVKVSDGLNHGTHCAGIMGALADNSNGIASVGFNIKIMPLKCGRKGSGGLFNPYKGVDYAINNGARVISMSWGGGRFSATYQLLFDIAFKKGIVCVAAAGNSSTSAIAYPAGFNNVIAVGSTTSTDIVSGFSNYGSWIDVVAPGSSIYSTLPGNIYGTMSGTSMACPMVSGLCALMLSKNPTATNIKVEACLKSGCDNINALNPGFSGQIGAGRINAYKSLLCFKSVNAFFSADKLAICPGDSIRFTDSSTSGITSWKWSFTGGSPTSSTIKNPTVKYTSAGVFDVQLIVGNGTEFDTIIRKNYISVSTPTVKMSGKQTIIIGDYATIKLDFTGGGPWDIQYSDGKKNVTVNNIQNSPYYILLQPDSSRIYKPVWIRRNGCYGTVSDSAVITVINPNPANCDSLLRFQYRFGGSGDDQGYQVAVLDDTSMVIVGKTTSYGSGSFDAFIAKVSNIGKVIWLKTAGGSGDDGFYNCAVDNSGNIYVGGYSTSGLSGRAATLVKYDKSGNQLWLKSYGGSGEYIFGLMISKDQKNIYYHGLSTGGYGSEDITIYKLDPSGSVVWTKQMGDASLNRNIGIYEDDYGSLYTCGPNANDALLVKMDNKGNLIWKKNFTDGSSAKAKVFQKICRWNKNKFLIAGYFSNNSTGVYESWATLVDTGGTIIWSKRYNTGSSFPYQVQLSGQTFILSGYSSTKSSDGYVMQLDSNGNVLKNYILGTSNAENMFGSCVDKNNCFYFVGYQNNGNNDIWVGRSNCKLDFYCNSTASTPTVSSSSITVSNYSINIQNFTTTASPTNNKNTGSPSLTVICRTGKDSLPPKNCNLKANFVFKPECPGTDVKFKDFSIDANGFTISNYFWDFGDSTSASGSASVSHKFLKQKSYKVKLTIVSSDGKRSCIDSISKIYVSSDKLRLRDNLRDTVICFGDSAKLAVFKPECGVFPYTYRWIPSKGVSDSTDPTPYFSPRKTTNYILKISDYNGQIAYDTFTVTVKTTCCKSFARFETSKETVCLGDSMGFVNTSTFKKNAVFNWYFTGANLTKHTGFTPPKLRFTSAGIQKVTLTLNDSCRRDTFVFNISVVNPPQAFAGRDTVVCKSDTVTLGGPANDGYQYIWSPQTGLDNPYISSPSLEVNASGKYFLKVVSDLGCVAYDTVNVFKYSIKLNIGNDTTLCTGHDINLSSNVVPQKYLWITGEKTSTILVKSAGLYWLQVVSNTCVFRDSIVINYDTMPAFNLGIDTTICDSKLPFTITATDVKWPAAISIWDNASSGLTRKILSPGIYWLEMQNNNCKFRDSIKIQVDPMPIWSLGPDTALCSNRVPYPLTPVGNFSAAAKYLWNNLTVSKSLDANSGLYWLQITDGKCVSRDSIEINVDLAPAFKLGKDTVLCESTGSLVLIPSNVSMPTAAKLWDNGSKSNSRGVSSSGLYWLQMKNGACTVRDSINVIFDKMPVFTLGADTAICESASGLILNPIGNIPANSEILWEDNSSIQSKTVFKSGLYWLQVKNSTCLKRDSVNVQIDSLPAFSLGNDTVFCDFNFPVQLKPENQRVLNVNYLWSTGQMSKQISAANPGTYRLILSNGKCVFIDSIKIESLSISTVKLPADTSICMGDTLFVKLPVISNAQYKWNTGENSPEKNILKTGVYWVTLSNICGKSADTIQVKDRDCSCPIYIPNSFTPSHSAGINDQYHVVSPCVYDKFEIIIYNRWGEIVFQSKNQNFAWNGIYKDEWVSNGAYLVVLKLKHKYQNGGREFVKSSYLYVAE